MTQQFVLGDSEPLNLNISAFLEKYKDQFEIQKRYSPCKSEPIELKVKMTIVDGGIEIEFLSEEDKQFFLENNKQHCIKLVQV